MALTFEQFFSAIAEQESGGNYSARGVYVKGDRAYGKYQVMGANIPSWTRQYFGKSLTPEQFLANPRAQEAVARGRLKSYWDKYGARGAASAWYSGNASLHNSTRSQPGGPSIKDYVDSVLNKAAKYPSGGSVDAGTAGTATGGTVPKLSDQELAEQYGFTLSFLNANKEIKSLFQQMVSGGWDKNRFQAKLRETKWWKTRSEDERAYVTLQYTDPATARQKKDQAYAKVRAMAAAIGLSATSAQLNEYAYLMLAKGYDDAMMRNFLGSKLNLATGKRTGAAGEAWNEAKALMYQYGSNWSDARLNDYVKRIVQGTGTMQDIKYQLVLEGKANFPQWSKQIDAGQTVMDIAQPYMASMSQILEIAPGSLNLFDPTIKNTLNWVNPGTLKKEAKPLWQFENELRSDPRWKATKNAQDSLMGVAHQVLADFGIKY